MPRRGGKRKKTRTHDVGVAPAGAQAAATSDVGIKEDIPRSIVAKASKVSVYVGELVKDLRRLMGPHTTNNLREKKYNRMKDYAVVAGQLGVSHIVVVSQTNSSVVLRVARHPDGPTLHFKIERYSLARQVRALQKRPFESTTACKLVKVSFNCRHIYLLLCIVLLTLVWAVGFPSTFVQS